MGGLDMLPSCLQAMIHRGGQAGFIAAQASLDATGHCPFMISLLSSKGVALQAACFLRVRAAFLADAERSAAGLDRKSTRLNSSHQR